MSSDEGGIGISGLGRLSLYTSARFPLPAVGCRLRTRSHLTINTTFTFPQVPTNDGNPCLLSSLSAYQTKSIPNNLEL